MRLSYEDGVSFDSHVYDLCESIKPKKCKDLEALSRDLHERIEYAIEDFINDSESLNIDDYESQY